MHITSKFDFVENVIMTLAMMLVTNARTV